MSSVSEPDVHPVHAAPGHLAHHFDTPAQQLESATFGMWLFLATEILLFGGLFCAYAVYRSNHPAIFEYAHIFLSKPLGAVNTVILLCSSFTMATAVWAVQHGRQRLLAWMLAVTIVCACAFLCIKYVEYRHKWQEGLLWGKYYRPTVENAGFAAHTAEEHGTAPPALSPTPATTASSPAPATPTSGPTSAPTSAASSEPADPGWVFQPASPGPPGLRAASAAPAELAPQQQVHNVQTFFGIYFTMTGLHDLHVIAGIAAISWLLARSLRGDFSAAYFTPVPMVGLYWHVVDLVWIYLFPLLYLIH